MNNYIYISASCFLVIFFATLLIGFFSTSSAQVAEFESMPALSLKLDKGGNLKDFTSYSYYKDEFGNEIRHGLYISYKIEDANKFNRVVILFEKNVQKFKITNDSKFDPNCYEPNRHPKNCRSNIVGGLR